jgi:hypothetical protein
MMRPQTLACAALAVWGFGCGPGNRGDGTGARVDVEPANAMVTVTDGVPVVQAYTATLIDDNGDPHDITSTVSFTLSSAVYGNWSGPSLSIGGGGAGVTQVVANTGAIQGSTNLTVFVKGSRDDGTVPPGAGGMFDNATENAVNAPTIAYPANNVILPPNLGQFDVHWQPGSGNNLFEISLTNTYVDLRIHKAGSGPSYSFFLPAEWTSVASAATDLTLTVAGMNTAQPATKSTSMPETIGTTNETVQGGLYYWTTSPPQGIFRYDMSTPGTPPSSFFPTNMAPGGGTNCVGCHTLSKDGTKIAMTIDSGDGRGAEFNVGDRSILIPFDTNAQMWNFATYNVDATKLLTLSQGQMQLRDAMGGAILVPSIPNMAGDATHPEISPDGTQLANVETTQRLYDFQVTGGTIVTRPFNDASNTFGPIKVLVANATNAANFYPSYSPDGQWILFTRTAGNSYSDATAEVWVVKSDGSAPPIRLANADATMGFTNSWARWTPFVQSYTASHQTLFYITFSSERQFGVRTLTQGSFGADKQIWMAPFFPDKANANMDPSGPAFRMPFQDFATSNHIAQWTQAVVIGKKADGSWLTQDEAVNGPAK